MRWASPNEAGEAKVAQSNGTLAPAGRSFGSSTALVAVLGRPKPLQNRKQVPLLTQVSSCRGQLGVANLGDSAAPAQFRSAIPEFCVDLGMLPGPLRPPQGGGAPACSLCIALSVWAVIWFAGGRPHVLHLPHSGAAPRQRPVRLVRGVWEAVGDAENAREPRKQLACIPGEQHYQQLLADGKDPARHNQDRSDWLLLNARTRWWPA